MDKKAIVGPFLVFLFLGFLTGCAAHSTKTVKSETTQYSAKEKAPADDRVITEQHRAETTETTKTESESGGIVSGAVDATGEILALPFRAVGGLIRLIF